MIMTYGQIATKRDTKRVALQPIAISAGQLTIETVKERARVMDKVMSWSELAELTHATQVEHFNWCSCEEQEQFPYDDCPKEGK
jgi:CelD/BcsL family acetyltransferase involved in cellulose biosynthesis